jgi:hypothetical protein
VRPPPLFFQRRVVGFAQAQRCAVVNRRLPAAELDLAFEVQLLRRLIGRIDAADRAQPLQGILVAVEAVRLAMLFVGNEAQPGEIVANP